MPIRFRIPRRAMVYWRESTAGTADSIANGLDAIPWFCYCDKIDRNFLHGYVVVRTFLAYWKRFPFMVRLVLAGFLLVTLAGCFSPSLLAPLERRMIFQPTSYPDGDWRPEYLAFEDAWIPTGGGEHIHGWFVEHPHPRAVILRAHGNFGNITYQGPTLKILSQRHGVSIMSFDYRGYGRSEGSPTETNILEDARAARRWLAERTGVAESDIVLMGRSLGGAVVVDLAAYDGARGLILESTFSSLPDVGAWHFPWLPVHWMMHHQLNSFQKIKSYRGPLLQSHGDADEVVPFQLGVKLHNAAPGRKRFVRIPGGSHNSPQTEEYHELLDAFIDALPPAQTMTRR